MKILKSRLVTVSFILWALITSTVFGINVPQLQHRVTDLAGVLSADQEALLENKLLGLEDRTSSQVVLLVISSLEGDSVEDYAMQVVETNKIGQQKYDNGVLLVIAMKDKKIRLEVGYGLESILTDARSSYIIQELISPNFKRKRFYEGISEGLDAVTGLITKEFSISPEDIAAAAKRRRRAKGSHLPIGTIVFVIILLLGFFKRGSRHGASSAMYWGGYGAGRHSSQGRWGGGGFGGGGFSGGGGSFGGGGASGGW